MNLTTVMLNIDNSMITSERNMNLKQVNLLLFTSLSGTVETDVNRTAIVE